MTKKLALTLGAAAASCALLSPLAAAAQPGDEAQIRALENRFIAAFSAKDLDGIMRVYAPDVFVFDLVPPRQYVGAKAYRDDFKALLATFPGPLKVTISDLVVHTDGTIGYSHSIQHLVGTGAKGETTDLTVRVTDIYRKLHGQWRIVQEQVSVPIDLATGKPDFTSAP